MNRQHLILESLQSIDKWDKDITKDEKGVFYYKGKTLKSVEDVESMYRYIQMNLGKRFKSNLSKDEIKEMFNTLWKAIPNKYHITFFAERGVVIRGIKNGKNINVKYKIDGDVRTYNGSWFLSMCIDDNSSMILSDTEAPQDIKYSDIKDDLGKTHKFKESNNKSGKKIQYEDDLVIVYDKNGKEIYKGIEDNEPMKDENWKYDTSKGHYTLTGGYVKVCVNEGQYYSQNDFEIYDRDGNKIESAKLRPKEWCVFRTPRGKVLGAHNVKGKLVVIDNMGNSVTPIPKYIKNNVELI